MNKDFFKKNFSWMHVGGILLGVILCSVYWWKSGQFSEFWFKRNLAVLLLMGALVGWITADMIVNSGSKDENKNQ